MPKPSSAETMLGPHTLELLEAQPADIQVVNDWHVGGGETYVTDFLLAKDGQVQHLLAKACVKFAPGETMKEWLGRRSRLEENGLKVPSLFLVDGATIVEEFIPFSLREAYAQADDSGRRQLQTAFTDTYKGVVGAGFSPVSLGDVRSRGEDIVIVDFGEDLGGWSEIDQCSLLVAVQAEKHFRQILY